MVYCLRMPRHFSGIVAASFMLPYDEREWVRIFPRLPALADPKGEVNRTRSQINSHSRSAIVCAVPNAPLDTRRDRSNFPMRTLYGRTGNFQRPVSATSFRLPVFLSKVEVSAAMCSLTGDKK